VITSTSRPLCPPVRIEQNAGWARPGLDGVEERRMSCLHLDLSIGYSKHKQEYDLGLRALTVGIVQAVVAWVLTHCVVTPTL
jgi:hypothetical protein